MASGKLGWDIVDSQLSHFGIWSKGGFLFGVSSERRGKWRNGVIFVSPPEYLGEGRQ
jgi:hypothetical protein